VTSSDSGDGTVTTTRDGGVWTVTIANPAKRNALDDPTRKALLAALDEAMSPSTAYDDCRVVVLTGEGSTFCAGGDLPSMPTDDVAAITARMGELHRIAELILRGPRPVIAAVEGAAYGSGLSLVAASDVVIAARDARFCAPFTRVGVAPDVGLLWSLPRRIGVGRARLMALSAEPVPAQGAATMGLVERVVEPGEALAAATELAGTLAERAPLALAATKRLVLAGAAPVEAALASELEEQIRLLASADFAEGRRAFFERCPAEFRGI
jgi:enoyl-CoA hydratase/carnithine racemase